VGQGTARTVNNKSHGEKKWKEKKGETTGVVGREAKRKSDGEGPERDKKELKQRSGKLVKGAGNRQGKGKRKKATEQRG